MKPPGTKDFSFPKEDRLLSPEDFTRVKRAGKRLSTRSFTLYMLPNGLGRRRLGLSVGSKAGGAVKRNRAKRLLREFFRHNRDLFPESVDVLVTVRSLEHVRKLADVQEELTRALESVRSGK